MRRFFQKCMFILIAGAVEMAWAQNQGQPQDLFFVLHSSSGSLVAQHDSGNHYILTLNDIPPDITYFSNHPRHLVGSILLNRLGIAASKRVNAGFSGALSFREVGPKNAKLTTTMIQVDHYVFLVNKDQVVAQVVLRNRKVNADHYDMKDILLQTDGMWFLPHLLAGQS